MARILIIGLLLAGFSSCSPQPIAPAEFEEVRVHRWTALEGGEIFVLRRIGGVWSAELLGDASRFRCLYAKQVVPKSDWNALWNTLIQEGLLEVSGSEPRTAWEDGDGFRVEVRSNGTTRQYIVDNPSHQSTVNAKRILRIGNLISKEFDTPMFAETYDRGKVADYLYAPCKKN